MTLQAAISSTRHDCDSWETYLTITVSSSFLVARIVHSSCYKRLPGIKGDTLWSQGTKAEVSEANSL